MDITQKLIYLFQFYWPVVLADDPKQVRQLTGGLLLASISIPMKKDLLRTILSILGAPDLPDDVRNALMSELVVLKDVLVAICHHESTSVVVEALSLLTTYHQELIPSLGDQHKIWLLMAKSRPSVQKMAKSFFLQYIRLSMETVPASQAFLGTLEEFVSKYQVSFNLIDVIVLND